MLKTVKTVNVTYHNFKKIKIIKKRKLFQKREKWPTKLSAAERPSKKRRELTYRFLKMAIIGDLYTPGCNSMTGKTRLRQNYKVRKWRQPKWTFLRRRLARSKTWGRVSRN